MSKYNLYRNNYNEHKENIAKCNKFIHDNVEKAKIEPQKKGFLIDALVSLSDAFGLLQWSYCLTYYLQDSKEKTLFLHQQKELSELTQELMQFITTKTVEDLCELKNRQSVLNKSRTIEKLRKTTLVSLEEGQLVEVILNQADSKNDDWACNLCGHVNPPVREESNPSSSSSSSSSTAAEPKPLSCAKCRACKLHGERECWGCTPNQH